MSPLNASTSVRRLVAVAALCASAPAWGAFTAMDSHAPSARLAGVDGALEGGLAGAEAAIGNPAAFAHGEDAHASFSGGNGGLAADWVGAGWVAVPVADDLSFGLAYEDILGGLGPGFSEQAIGLSAGLVAAPALSLGLRGWMLQASTGPGLQSSGRGFSMDAGARSEISLGKHDTLFLGATGSNLVSEWPDRFWRRSVPLSTRLGVGWSRDRFAWAGLQFERADGSSAGIAPRQGFRFGVESLAFRSFQVRAGASTFKDQAYSVGASAPFSFWRIRAAAHYALVIDQDAVDLKHRVQIDLGYRVRQRTEIFAVPLQVVFEPGTKKVKSARISLNVEGAGESSQEWELEIRDKNGNIVRVLRGTGIPPAFVTWDGKDALGQSIDDGDQVSYRLNIKTASGIRTSKDAFATEATLNTEGLSELSIPTSGEGALVVPVMGADGKASQLLLRPPTMPGETQHWEIVIQDADGNTLKKLEGTGALPSELLWDGTDDKGQRISEKAGLRIRFNAFDRSGNLSSVDQQVDGGLQPISSDEAEEAIPRLGLRMPALREGGPALEMLLSDSTLKPLKIPVEGAPEPTPKPTKAPTAMPTAKPTKVPTLVPTAAPTAIPTAVPTPPPTAIPTVEATPIPTEILPTPIPSPMPKAEAETRPLLAGLQSARFLDDPSALPPAIMTRDQAAARGPRPAPSARPRPSQPSTLRATVAGVLDVFKPGTAVVDEAKYGDKLQAFYWRLQSYKRRRLQLTGLIKDGENGGEALSRERAREISRRMVEEGGFDGEFILRVDGKPGAEGGVRVEILSR